MSRENRRSFRRPIAVTTLLAGFVLLGAPRAVRAQDTGIAVGAMAPSAAVAMLDGTPVELSRWIGKGPVVLEFWATWCPLCRKLEPQFAAAKTKYAGKVTFVAVGVPQNQTPEKQRAYREKEQLAGEFVFDRDAKAIAAYKVPHTSYVVVIDAKGKVVYTGVSDEQQIDAAVAKALVP